jgi:erythromycin esterase
MLKRKLSIILILILAIGIVGCDKIQTSEQWYEKNTYEIKSLESDDYSDLEFLKPLLKNKRVVSLGENFHRVSEYRTIKTKIIKYLHEELGYDAIGFESGLGECAMVMNNNELTPRQMMENSTLPVWHSEETLKLFDYIKEQKETKKPLELFGYDMQFTSMYFIDYMTQWLAKVDEKKAEEYSQMEIGFLQSYYTLLNKYGFETVGHINEYQKIIDKYQKPYNELIKYIKDNRNALENVYPENKNLVDCAIRTLDKRMTIVKMSMVNTVESYNLRDVIMAENVEWYLTVNPDKKIILWAHNDHLTRNTSKMLTLEKDEWVNSFKSMGEILSENLEDDIYVLGFYMKSGRATSINTVKDFEIPEVPEGSLEEIINRSGYENTFVDLSKHTKENKFNKWMFSKQYASEDGLSYETIRTNAMQFIPKEQYDGIIVLKQVSSPILLQQDK